MYASFGKENVHLTLYHSRHTEPEKILLSGNCLSNIPNLIERECALNLLRGSSQDGKLEKRLRAHRLRAGLEDPSSDEDRRMATSLIADRNDVLALRGRSMKICAWEEMPGR